MTDLSLHQLGTDFLEFLHDWHASSGFLPFLALAAAEGIEVDDTRDTDDQYIHHKRRILLNRDQGVRRKRFTGMHEIAHHVFKTADGGRFVKALQQLFPRSLEAQNDYEEVFVQLGGFQLMIPRPVFREICDQYEEDAKRAQMLAIRAGCSFAAAGQRIALAMERPVGGIVLNTQGEVLDFFVNEVKKYLTAGRGFTIDERHPIRQKPFPPNEVEFFRSTIPYKHSQKKIPRHMQGLYDDKRGQTIIFFNAPHSKKRGQHKLFSDFY